MNYYQIKDKDSLQEYQSTHPDFIIPLIYDCVGRNILKNNKKVLLLIINNVLNERFEEEDIILKDGRVKKERRGERQRECDVFVEVDRRAINIEINKKKTSSMNQKNMSYLGDLLKNYYEEEIIQINLNDFDMFKRGEPIYLSKIKEEESGRERFEHLKIYDVSIGNFKKLCYTNSIRYENDFIKLMEIFESNSRREIESKIGSSTLLREVYEMQDKLSREDFVLERFPDDIFHEMEKKEMKEVGIEQGRKEGIKEGEQKVIKKMLEKNMSKEEIANLLDYDLKMIEKIEKQ